MEEDCITLNIQYCNLVSFEKYVKLSTRKAECSTNQIESLFFNELSKWEYNLSKTLNLEENVLTLVKMKMLSLNLELFRGRIDEKINQGLASYKSKFGIIALTHLGQQLNLDKSGVGRKIISDYKGFQGFTLSLFNTKTKAHKIDYVLENLKGDDIEKERLLKRYIEFDSKYKSLIQLHLRKNLDLIPLISDIKLLAGHHIQDPQDVKWNIDMATKLPKLLAYIFAIWTLQNAEHYFEARDLADKESYLLQPHAAQVISIFRLLGVGDKKEVLRNNLVQIGTGEGKSVTLAATASVLALLGFEVNCACYSKYLSERDYEAFKGLFDILNISKYIQYGTFNRLCEAALNKNGDLRQVVRDMISKGVGEGAGIIQQSNRAKILLVDEVDVFFSKDFYGGLYTPSTVLADPAIGTLTDLIWKMRDFPINLQKIKNTQEYQSCCSRFKSWAFLIEEAVKDMLFDLKAYKSHDYVVKDNKIGYKEFENISFDIIFRYQTLFAYYAEHEKGNISLESLNANKSIRLKCGHFSYAEIPNLFSFIMGVTGTLETLSKKEREIIEKKYKIYKNTYSPSVFGKNNSKFIHKDDVAVEDTSDYHLTILREIKERLRGRDDQKRAVLVFFESAKKLNECLELDTFQEIRDRIDCLTEEADFQERETRIKRATSSGHITFLTKTFGRGTDFVCHDETVNNNYGVHVIQTFVSEEFSEEVQIRGRTARQGNRGSYSLVLLKSSLEKFLIKSEDIEKVEKGVSLKDRVFSWIRLQEKTYDTIYELINDRRNDLFESQFVENEKFVEEANKHHWESLKFLNALTLKQTQEIENFLLSENRGVSEARKSKTLVLMDATISMSQLLHKAKNTVQTMVERTWVILKENKLNEDSFQIQFAVYRNYNCREDRLLQYSPWETKPDSLRKFLEKIQVEGGMGNEAIEIGLWHANNENKKDDSISQVILIGDAPANSKSEVKMKREGSPGEKYWSKTKFANQTHYSVELQHLKNDKVPVHAFYVASSAQHNFQEIAFSTGGRCEPLDINSGAGAAMLTNLVTEVILNKIGQENGKGGALVDAYRNKFIKSYAKQPLEKSP